MSEPLVRLETPALRLALRPARGAAICELALPGGPNALAWHEWEAPIPAERGGTYGRADLDWLSGYRGGWQGLLPNLGPACTVAGVVVGFHGELSTAPWEVVRCDPDAIELRAGARLPLVVRRRIALDADRPVVRIEEVVRNEGTAPMPFLWGHHPAFPALAGARIDVPARTVRVEAGANGDVNAGEGRWPTLPGPDGDVDLSRVSDATMERLCYLTDVPEGWAALRQPAGMTSVALAWDRATFPHLWCWQLLGADGFPWFGRARMLTLEPMSAWPVDGLAAAVERGQAHWLAPGEERATWVTAALFAGSEEPVTGVTRSGEIGLASGSAA